LRFFLKRGFHKARYHVDAGTDLDASIRGIGVWIGGNATRVPKLRKPEKTFQLFQSHRSKPCVSQRNRWEKEPNESPLESIRFLAADKSAIRGVGRTDVFFKTL